MMRCFHVNLLSRFMPRYLTVSLLGTVILLMDTCGQVCFGSVKVTCVDSFSLILKPLCGTTFPQSRDLAGESMRLLSGWRGTLIALVVGKCCYGYSC